MLIEYSTVQAVLVDVHDESALTMDNMTPFMCIIDRQKDIHSGGKICMNFYTDIPLLHASKAATSSSIYFSVYILQNKVSYNTHYEASVDRLSHVYWLTQEFAKINAAGRAHT